MMTLTGKRLARYEMLMKNASNEGFEMTEDFLCQGCPHHRPDWEYRFCEFLECPQVKGVKTFWEEVLEGVKPVSYTHLDVYKRQGCGRASSKIKEV